MMNLGSQERHHAPIPEFGGLTETGHVYCRAYVASRPPEIRRMMRMETLEERVAEAKRLLVDPATQDLKIDPWIDIEGGNGRNPLTCAFGVNVMRVVTNGQHWTMVATRESLNSALGPQFDPAGFKSNTGIDISAFQQEQEPLFRCLKVSLLLENYPPHISQSTGPRPFGPWPLVGDGSVGTIYWATDQDNHDGYGAVWADGEGQEYLKFFTQNGAYRLVKYRRVK